MLNVRGPHSASPPNLTELAIDEIAVKLLDHLVDARAGTRLRDDLAHLGNALSPHELSALYQFLFATTTEDGCTQIAGIAPMWLRLLNTPGATFSRETLFDGSRLYRSAVHGPVRPALVCFTSRQNGMFMPNCRFLELLGNFPIDIVINSTDSGTFGMWNLQGCGSFAGSLALLKAALAERGIVPRAYAGASAGGGPAVYAATLDAGTSAVLFGLRFFVPGRNIPLSMAGPAFEPICECWSGPLPRVYNIFGALQGRDAENNARLQALVAKAKSYPIPVDDTHSPMVTLTARRKLRGVFDLLVKVASGATVDFDMVVS